MVAQCGVSAASRAAKQSVVILVHEKVSRDLGSGFDRLLAQMVEWTTLNH